MYKNRGRVSMEGSGIMSTDVSRDTSDITSKSIAAIKREIQEISIDDPALLTCIQMYEADPRIGVQTLLRKARLSVQALEDEKLRTQEMSRFEHEYASYEYICGIDEVGRGPLAGPVVAGAVILPKDCDILYLNDSKKLSEKKREVLYDVIMEQAIATGIGIVSPQDIDEMNILQATYKAMRIAIENLNIAPNILLNDAVVIPGVEIKQVPIIKGDAKSISIAAASIIAKVTRDRMMVEYDKIMPEYKFASNKGYGADVHYDALRKYGVTPIHRMSFLKNFFKEEHAE